MASIFTYPITRSLTYPYFTVIFISFSTIWLVVITIINLIVVGYENASFEGSFTSFNTSPELWYQRFVPTTSSGIARSLVCNTSVIPLNTGTSLSDETEPWKGLFTAQTGRYPYTLRSFRDTRKDIHASGMVYANNFISNCSVQRMQISQFLWQLVGDHVSVLRYQDWVRPC